MKFIEALKLKSKLLFLFLLITFGLIATSVIGTANINAMKKNIDAIYFGSLIPITELNEIVQIYNGELYSSVFRAKASEINSDEFRSSIQSSIDKIETVWSSYESHFKRDEELQYVEYVSAEIEKINIYFKNLLGYENNLKQYRDISLVKLEEKVQHIHQDLKKLINYEEDIAEYERKKFLDNYRSTLEELGVVFFIVILGILSISYYVFKSIQDDQTELEIAHKKLKVVNKKLEDVSYTDSLTELHNRRYFNMVYDREVKRAKRSKNYFTFMMLDIDYFKQYNDTYGHIHGDLALKKVASQLSKLFKRPSDYVFRLGGEEFGILMSETDQKSSSQMAQKICDSILDLKIEHRASEISKYITISVGIVSCIVDPSVNEEHIITKADDMLYKAKESGRNKYILYTNGCN